MKKILFFSFPAAGHVNSSIEFCKALGEKDVEVCYVTFKEYFAKFNDVKNVRMIDYCQEYRDYYFEHGKQSGKIKRSLVKLLKMLYDMTDILAEFASDLVEKEKPDLIIADPFCIAGKMAAKSHNIPLVLFFSLFMTNPIKDELPPGIGKEIIKNPITFIKTMMLLKKIDKKYGNCDKPGDILSHQGCTTVVTTSRELHPNGEYYPKNVLFAGPNNVVENLQDKKEKLIFVSLGTIESNPDIVKSCVAAMSDLDAEMIITIANNLQNDIALKDIPENVKIYSDLPPEEFRKIIERASLFVNSGGVNSVNDSIGRLTPLLICAASQETHDVGVLVDKYKCGKLYTGKPNDVEKIHSYLQEMLYEKEQFTGLEKYRKSFLNSMGFKKVADEVIKDIDFKRV